MVGTQRELENYKLQTATWLFTKLTRKGNNKKSLTRRKKHRLSNRATLWHKTKTSKSLQKGEKQEAKLKLWSDDQPTSVSDLTDAAKVQNVENLVKAAVKWSVDCVHFILGTYYV